MLLQFEVFLFVLVEYQKGEIFQLFCYPSPLDALLAKHESQPKADYPKQ